jgi:hypothetical protein
MSNTKTSAGSRQNKENRESLSRGEGSSVTHDQGIEDLPRLRQELASRAARAVRLGRCGLMLMIVGFVSGVAGAGLREALKSKNPLGLVLGMGMFLAGMILALRGHRLFRRLHCPACQRSLTEDFGAHCGNCGSRTLERSSVGFAARCTSCGAGWKAPDALNPRLQFCTHCGVVLIESTNQEGTPSPETKQFDPV